MELQNSGAGYTHPILTEMNKATRLLAKSCCAMARMISGALRFLVKSLACQLVSLR